MIKAKDIMVRDVISLSPDTEISKAVELLLNNHFNGVPVIDANGLLIGVLCQSDLIFQKKDIPFPPIFTILDGIIPLSSSKKLEKEFQKISATKVEHAMVTEPVSVDPETPVSEIASLMVEKHFHTIPVVENKKLVGIIGKEDILRILMAEKRVDS
ncbi:MAG: CBS domain-containing protein [Desulfobacterales bacterium]|nr:CBS domain-containing protein [Desulfobacterales bacterium]